MARLLAAGPRVIATGGGAFMSEETRARISEGGISIWLKADLDVLWRRVRKRSHRPLLHSADPESVLKKLLVERYPVYAQAEIEIISQEGPHDAVVDDLLAGLEIYLSQPPLRLIGGSDMTAAADRAAAVLERVNVDLGARSYDILIGEAS